MCYLPGTLHHLQTAQSGKIIIDHKYVIVLVAGKLFERAIAIRAELKAPVLRDGHVVDQFRYLFIVLDVQNGNLRGGPHRTLPYDLSLDLSGFGKKVMPPLSYSGPCLEQFPVAAVNQSNEALMMTEAKQARSPCHGARSISTRTRNQPQCELPASAFASEPI